MNLLAGKFQMLQRDSGLFIVLLLAGCAAAPAPLRGPLPSARVAFAAAAIVLPPKTFRLWQSASTTLYVKTSGTGNTGWVAK